MSILAFLTDPPIVSAILLLDQTAAFDLADADPDPGFEFDQSLPPGFDG